MPALPTPGTVKDWSAIITTKALPFMNATVQVVKPNPPTPYDPVTDTGGDAVPTIIRTGPARIQKIRRPLNIAAPKEWSTSHQIRVQMPLDNTVPLVTKGMQIIVLNGGKETDLEQLVYEVTMSVNSSWAALSTYEAIAEIVPR
jgi:hypothetical protein